MKELLGLIQDSKKFWEEEKQASYVNQMKISQFKNEQLKSKAVIESGLSLKEVEEAIRRAKNSFNSFSLQKLPMLVDECGEFDFQWPEKNQFLASSKSQ